MIMSFIVKKSENFENIKSNGYCYISLFNEPEVKKILLSSKKIVQYFEDKNELSNLNLDIAVENESYEKIDNSSKSILVDRRRSYYDNGMIDIFNPHKINSKISEDFVFFRERIKENCIKILQNIYKKKFILSATNIYRHQNTTRPRVAHYDNEEDYFKLFLYLSDVEQDDGAFFFYKSSHKQKIKKFLMNKVNKYILKKPVLEDKNFIFSDKNKINLKGKVGTTVLTNVSGLHGCNAFRKDKNFERLVIVQRIVPV